METRIVTFKFERETKNTVRFEEVAVPGTPPIMGTVYVQKWVLDQPLPQTIKVTLEGVDG